ncbi:MAG: TlpA disulfide reductase family protein [Chitinophagales bacterium]
MRLYVPLVALLTALLLPFITIAQTQSIKGSIANDATNKAFTVTLAQYKSSYYQAIASAPVSANGTFDIQLNEPLLNSCCQLWFPNGDSILFIAGSDKQLDFKARWYEGLIIETGFTNSAQNKQLWQVKGWLTRLKAFEDSVGHAGVAIDEFDPKYTTKSSALKSYYQSRIVELNKELSSIAEAEPNGYCAKAIIPALLKANMVQSASGAEFDNNRSFQHYHFFDFINATDTLLATSPFLRQQLFTYMDLWVNQNEKGLQKGVDELMKKFNLENELKKYVLTALTDYFTERNNFPLVDYLFNNFYNTCEAPPLVGKSAEIVEQMKRLAPDNKAPDLIMPDAAGNYFWLSTMKTRKNVVLYFYASWCQHCQKVTPDVINYAHEMKSKGVDFVAVSLDSKKEAWLNFIAKNKLDWINISDLRYWDSEAVKLYALRATPTFYVLDGSLNIIKRTNELDDVKKVLTK